MTPGDILMIVFTGIVAASAIAYTWVTWRLLRETAAARQDQLEPNVIAFFKRPFVPAETKFVIGVQNIGPDVAYRVSFELSPKFKAFLGQSTEQREELSRKTIPVLGPGESRIYFEGTSGIPLSEVDSADFWMKAHYRTPRGRTRVNEIWLDPSSDFGKTLYDTPSDNRLARALESIDRSLRDQAAMLKNAFSGTQRF